MELNDKEKLKSLVKIQKVSQITTIFISVIIISFFTLLHAYFLIFCVALVDFIILFCLIYFLGNKIAKLKISNLLRR